LRSISLRHRHTIYVVPEPSGKFGQLGKPTVAVKRPILEFLRGQGINGSDSQVGGLAVT